MKILTPYLKSTNSSIRMTAHGIAVHLSVFLSEDKLKELALTSVEINKLVDALGHSLESPDLTVGVFDIKISAREILSELDLSMAVKSNVKLLLKSNILNYIPSALKVDDSDTQEAAISFVWTITITSRNEITMNDDFQQQLLVASSILKQLSISNISVSSYALLSFQPDIHTGKFRD